MIGIISVHISSGVPTACMYRMEPNRRKVRVLLPVMPSCIYIIDQALRSGEKGDWV